MPGMNEFVINDVVTANDANALRALGCRAYAVNVTSGVVEEYLYYQATDVAAYAIVSGSVLHAADIELTKGSGDRNGTNTLGSTFLGIAQATMTASRYGWAMRRGVMAGVKATSGAGFAAGAVVAVDATATGKDGQAVDIIASATIVTTDTATIKATTLLTLRHHIGICKVAESSGTFTCIVAPLMSLPQING